MKENECEECTDKTIHYDTINQVIKEMPTDDVVFELADLFKLFGDSTRIKIIYAISRGEVCVCDIAETIHMTQSAVSHQLKNLKQARLIKSRKDGKVVYYSLDDEHIESIFKEALKHILERM